MKNMGKMTQGILFTVALLCAAGCQKQDDMDKKASATTEVATEAIVITDATTEEMTEATEEVTETTEETAETTNEWGEYDGKVLKKVSAEGLPELYGYLPSPMYMSVGNSKVIIFSVTDIDEESEHTSIDLYDIQKNEMTHLSDIDEIVCDYRCFGENEVLISGTYQTYLLSIDSGNVEKTELPLQLGALSNDGKTYYYAEDSVLYQMNMSDKKRKAIKLEGDLGVESVDDIYVNKNILLVKTVKSSDEYETVSAMIDLNDGSMLALDGDSDDLTCNGDCYYALYVDNWLFDGKSDIICGSIMKKDDVKLAGIPELKNGYGRIIANSDYAMIENSEETSAYSLWKLGEKIGKCQISDFGLKTMPENMTYISEENIILCSAFNGISYDVAMIDLNEVEFTDEMDWTTIDAESIIIKSSIKK